jgi:putative transposase
MPMKHRCRRHGFSEASVSLRHGKHGGVNVSDVKRLNVPEAKSTRRQKLLA